MTLGEELERLTIAFAEAIESCSEGWERLNTLLPIEYVTISTLAKRWDLISEFYGDEEQLTAFIYNCLKEIEYLDTGEQFTKDIIVKAKEITKDYKPTQPHTRDAMDVYSDKQLVTIKGPSK